MDLKAKLTRSLRSSTSDKEALNRQILKWNRSFKEVEQVLNHGKGRQRRGQYKTDMEQKGL
ncbi:MAG: hypothetical protein Q4C73_08840 [Eubacteriales bacterium]|nr:hypothetical protein [Eubacteriales bacterium]